jgi:hypothetical protein
MSAPHTTGAVALILSARPELRGQIDTIQHILRATAEPKVDAQCPPYVGHPNNVWGWGILDAYAAVQYAQGLSLGRLQGTVTAATTGIPLPGTRIAMSDGAGWNLLPRTTDGSGAYSSPLLPPATYNVTATLYGYLPATATVAVPAGLTVTQDITLSTAPQWTVSGTVVEAVTLVPLRATVVFSGTGLTARTDPASGSYSATIYQGDYWTLANSPGHTGQINKLPVHGNRTDNYALTPIYSYYPRSSDRSCGPALDWIDARDGTRVCLDDNAAATVNMGRSFPFYGSTYSFLFVGSNGIATFQLPANSYPLHIPDRATPNNGIYAFALDLNPANCTQGEVFYKAAGNTFVVEYYRVQHAPSGNPETFEMVLNFDTGLVTMQYLTVSNPASAVVGVENDAGTEATAYGGAVHSGLALAYFPAFGAPPYEQGTGVLAGQVVVSGTGAPLSGATVAALNPVRQVFTATTDLSGTYALPLCADFYTVTAAAAGYTPSTPLRVTVFSDTTTLQDFALEPLPVCEPVQVVDFSWDPLTPTLGQVVTLSGWVNGAGWLHERVDDDGGTNGSLALDAAGRPHISYRVINDPVAGLRYAYFDGTRWNIEVVDGGGDMGAETSLALDSAGRPHISYEKGSNVSIRYAHYDGVNWLPETVGYGWDPSMAVDSSDRPRIAYSRWRGEGYELDYAWFDGTVWQTSTVDADTYGISVPSLVLDAAGRPHISYQVEFDGLRYAYLDGSAWVTTTVAYPSWGGRTSIALDSAGRPRIAYYDIRYYGSTLQYAHLEGSAWTVESVSSLICGNCYEVSLALDDAGRPHISYGDGYSNVMYAHHDGTSWQLLWLGSGNYPALALTSMGRPAISFWGETDDALEYTLLAFSPTPPITYTWDLGDGALLTGDVVTHSYATPGDYRVLMTATNACPSSASAVHTVTVVPACAPADILTITTAISRCAATFSAEVTGTAPLAYLWAFGDGMTSTAVQPTHAYTRTGAYTGTLEVQNCGGTATLGFTVQVDCAPPRFTIYLPLVTRGYVP